MVKSNFVFTEKHMYQNKISLSISISILIIILSIISHFSFYQDTAAAQVNGGTSSSSSSSCNCVIFRIDDISDNHASSGIAVMNLFISENQPLTLGIVMNHIGKNPALMEKIMEGTKKGLFELALHGYDHLNYKKLPAVEQIDQLSNANQRMQDLFGKPSKIFIPPYDTFNNDTVDAMKRLGIRILSAGEYVYPGRGYSQYHIFSANGISHNDKENLVYHIPRTTGLESFDIGFGNVGKVTKLPLGEILNQTHSHILKFGYAVIVMHPTTFQIMANGKYTTAIDQQEINTLKTLIDSIKSKNIHVTTFSKIAGIPN